MRHRVPHKPEVMGDMFSYLWKSDSTLRSNIRIMCM